MDPIAAAAVSVAATVSAAWRRSGIVIRSRTVAPVKACNAWERGMRLQGAAFRVARAALEWVRPLRISGNVAATTLTETACAASERVGMLRIRRTVAPRQ